MGSVFGRWAEIVGRDLRGPYRPDSFADGELAVTADSTAWATQVRLLAPVLVKRLDTELGDGSVRRVKVRGRPAPAARRLARATAAKAPAIPTARLGGSPPGASTSPGPTPTRGPTRPWLSVPAGKMN